MQQRCPRCGVGFVEREPFVRVETLERAPVDHDLARFAVAESSLFHLHCAPWGDPRYRIARPHI